MHGQYIGSLHTMPANIVHQCMLRLDHPSTRCPGKVLHTVSCCSEATAAEGQQSSWPLSQHRLKAVNS